MSDARTPTPSAPFDLWLALLYGVAIFVLGSLPNTPPVAREVGDKVQHFIGFGLLAWLWCRALCKLCPGWGLRWIVLGGFGVSVALGGALELWQSLLSYRSCDVRDWAADALGASVGGTAFALFRLWFGARSRAAE
jgi:VanZ family protein